MRSCVKVTDDGIVEYVVKYVTLTFLWAATNCFVLYEKAAEKAFPGKDGCVK